MRWSQLTIPTLRETPADAEVPSHQLLLRAGYIRPLASGIYNYLFLGQRSLLKIIAIVREEMDRIGQELYLPVLHPEELWRESGRWDIMGETMFRLQDRGKRWMCLGMTHEEVMTDLARRELRSYRQLPQIWYQIQSKFRDEPRPKGGLLRTRQFTMKDSYSFDLEEEGLRQSYQKHYDTYCRIFRRCGLEYVAVEAHSGAMGGSHSHEFMVVSESGEDRIARCTACGYAANLEKAVSRLPEISDAEAGAPEKFPTPGQRTIDDLAAFTGLPPARLLKTLVYEAGQTPALVLLRGDHTLSESKIADRFPGEALRPAHPEEIRALLGASVGSLGPVGVRGIRILADRALEGRKDLVCGANEDEFHLRHVAPGRDFAAEYHDLRMIQSGELCAVCGAALGVDGTIEVGHIFQLGKRYSESMGARVLDQSGNEVTLWMGSYGIGMERILAAAAEQRHDENGLVLPAAIAPFEVVVVPVHVADTAQQSVAEDIYAQARQEGLDVLLDDREERPGVKFKDADLIGIPFRVTVGKKVTTGLAEVRDRSTGQTTDVKIKEINEFLRGCCRAKGSDSERGRTPASGGRTVMNSANRSERGGGSFSMILGLVTIAAVVVLAIRLLPPYIANYQLQDYLDNTARTATYSPITEADLKKEIMGRGRELGISLEDRQVAVQKVRGGSVNIAITYEVPVDLIAREVVLRFAPSAGNQNITAR